LLVGEGRTSRIFGCGRRSFIGLIVVVVVLSMAGAGCLSSDEGATFVSEASGGQSWRVWHTGSVFWLEVDILE
jgi:hypothetical protein